MALERILEPEVMDSPDEAAAYDQMDHSQVNARFVDDLLAVAPEPGDLLDLGTGTALIPIELCRRHPECRVIAADLSIEMLELARYRLEIAMLTHRIQLAHVDAKKMPFRDGMFDTLMSNSIVHHIPEPRELLREAVRVTRAGGLLFIRDLCRPDSQEELEQLVETYARNESEHARRMFRESLHAALTLAEIRALAAELGFPNESVAMTSDRHWTWSARKEAA
ncbi:MAG: class I SAM-dependent methyltransferase [Planctomycetes bacterium]|nr:class I SAM-dependent methyltransferase [Planctomycetota bacterium]